MALPEVFDNKYNHHHVLFWIVVRDFNGLKMDDPVPTWYPGLAKLMDWNIDCKTITSNMIKFLEK